MLTATGFEIESELSRPTPEECAETLRLFINNDDRVMHDARAFKVVVTVAALLISYPEIGTPAMELVIKDKLEKLRAINPEAADEMEELRSLMLDATSGDEDGDKSEAWKN